ncbi:MAG: substrate-binding domain-containing protein [Deltaproteobacteria bacterium]|jgi:molybdate/tungstate transport system substrate-binding protein|nr:substrate-binding domain-containing protein [Deltaproteobacteria bacterium]
MTKELKIFTAGVAMGAADQTVSQWNVKNPDFPAKLSPGGSVAGVKQYLAGEAFDVLIVADEGLITSLLMPQEASGYAVFAGNKMVVVAGPNQSIDSTNWVEKLTDPKAVFAHFDPVADPGGYRAVLAMSLADHFQPGLSKKLLEHPGRLILTKPGPPGTGPVFDYIFGYYSMAKKRGASFAQLPEVMDLSADALAATYAEAEFRIDERTVIRGAPIAHALAIPAKAPNPVQALEWSQLFLAQDFSALGFLPRQRLVGSLWPSERI